MSIDSIDKFTKKGIARLLKDYYYVDVADFEGSQWSKQEGYNLLAYHVREEGILWF